MGVCVLYKAVFSCTLLSIRTLDKVVRVLLLLPPAVESFHCHFTVWNLNPKNLRFKMSCHYTDLASPAVIEIPGGLKDGHQFHMCGKVSNTEPRFSINFQKTAASGTDIAFHFNPRNDGRYVVRNTYQNGWQHEETATPSFPFDYGKDFEIDIHVTSSKFEVYVNSQFFLDYAHRLDHHDMHYLRLTDGAEWHDLCIREKCRVPYKRNLPELADGMCVNVKGLINNDAGRFHVNFSCDDNESNIALHCNPRQSQSDTVLNSKINGSWGPEERGFAYFPFTRGEFFDLSFVVCNGHFIISANGKHLADYNYRVPLDRIQFLHVVGDIALMSVTVHDQLLNDCVKPIHGGLHTDDMIIVEGFFKPGEDRFQVNLLTGMSADCDRALHVNPRRAQKEVVLNNRVSGQWQTEVKYPLPDSMCEMDPFCMIIVNKESQFDIHIDGEKLGSFPHRVSVEDIKSIYCTADAYFHSIRILHKLPNPHSLKVPGNAVEGDWISVMGIPPQDSVRFIVDVKNGASTNENSTDDVLFHYNPRFSQGETVRNTQKDGWWGTEEKEEPQYPFEKTELFEINMLLTNADYKVVANREHHIDYNHRIPASQISHIITRLDADFYIKDFY